MVEKWTDVLDLFVFNDCVGEYVFVFESDVGVDTINDSDMVHTIRDWNYCTVYSESSVSIFDIKCGVYIRTYLDLMCVVRCCYI